MRNKKGQITLFLLIGIAILFITAIAMYFMGRESGIEMAAQQVSGTEFEETAQAVENFVKQCVRRGAEDALLVAGNQGGYTYLTQANISPKFVKYMTYTIPYLAMANMSLVPSNQVIEEYSLDAYIPWSVKNCLGEYAIFPGVNVSETKLKVRSTIEYESVAFDIDYPISISQGNLQKRLEKYSFSVPVRLGKIMEIVNKTVETTVEFPGFTDVGYLSRLDMEFEIIPYDKDTNIYIITDTGSTIMNQPYNFIFATIV